MLATMPGDAVQEVRVLSTDIDGASIQALGLPVGDQSQLARLRWINNRLGPGTVQSEIPAYTGRNPNWVFGG